MKTFPTALVLSAFLSLALVGAAGAGVLLPEDTDKSTGNLGLLPLETPQPEAEPAKPAAKTAPTPSKTTTITPGGTVAKPPPSALEKLLADKIMKGKLLEDAKPLTPFQLQMQEYNEQKRKEFEVEPTILDEVNIPVPDFSKDESVKSALLVAVSQAYTWGPMEAKIIKKSFGYEAEEIAQKCQIRFTVLLGTVKEKYRFSTTMFAGEQKSVPYDENLLSVSLQPHAVCMKPETLPRGGLILRRVGDNLLSTYLVKKAECLVPANTPSPTSLEVRYQGDGKAGCVFN